MSRGMRNEITATAKKERMEIISHSVGMVMPMPRMAAVAREAKTMPPESMMFEAAMVQGAAGWGCAGLQEGIEGDDVGTGGHGEQQEAEEDLYAGALVHEGAEVHCLCGFDDVIEAYSQFHADDGHAERGQREEASVHFAFESAVDKEGADADADGEECEEEDVDAFGGVQGSFTSVGIWPR